MTEGEQTVRGPGGVEVVISFLPNNEILVRVPPPFVVRTETLEVGFPLTSFALICPPQANRQTEAARRRRQGGRWRWKGRSQESETLAVFQCRIAGIPSHRASSLALRLAALYHSGSSE